MYLAVLLILHEELYIFLNARGLEIQSDSHHLTSSLTKFQEMPVEYFSKLVYER